MQNDYSAMILGETPDAAMVESRADAQAALQQLLSQTSRYVDIVSRDLDRNLFNRAEVCERLKAIMLSNRHARVRVCVHETRRLVHGSHCLLELSRKLSSYMSIRVSQGEFRKYNKAFVLVDNKGFLVQNVADRYEGEACFYAAREAENYSRLFEDMWEQAKPDAELRALNI